MHSMDMTLSQHNIKSYKLHAVLLHKIIVHVIVHAMQLGFMTSYVGHVV